MNIVILAAGQGKRMKSALPKVLHPIAGRPMLAHVIDTARAVAASVQQGARIVVVIGHGAEAVRTAFPAPGAGPSGIPDGATSRPADAAPRFVVQDPQLGTGHAVRQAVPALDDSALTLVLYGDVPLVRPGTLQGLVEATQRAGGGVADAVGVLTVLLDDPTGYGRVVRDDACQVRRIVEHKDAGAEERAIREVNTGIVVAPTRRLIAWLERLTNANAQHEYYLTDIIGMAVADGVPVVGVVAPEDETRGVNSKVQLAQLERLAQHRAAEALMEAGVRLADPARIDVRGTVSCEGEVFVDVNCVFEGDVHLADGVRIGPNCVIRDCRIGAGTEVFAFCHLESAVIGAGARIGPYARTRPDTTLGDEVHIGNFVEVKNSRMARGAKANHLSYVGDAVVGEDVNIGAGTIIANYDGANKHRTVIGDRAHTGSNSVLVAPIEIGADATVGAGSTVSFKVPAGKLTVARARQTIIEGWTRPKKKPK